ncbi:glycosyltransferase [Streptomyces showdoensis]
MLMRIGLLTESGYPYASGESGLWCDRLVRGLAPHEFDVYALSRDARQESGARLPLPPNVREVRTASLWAPEDDGRGYGRRERRGFETAFRDLAAGICAEQPPTGPGAAGPGAAGPGAGEAAGAGGSGEAGDAAERFAAGLYGLAELARSRGGLRSALRSEAAVRVLESAGRAPGARRGLAAATVPDHLAFLDRLERALRPLSLDWYDEEGAGLGRADLCHAASAGAAALPGLLAKRFFGTPLLVTEYGVQLRAHYLAAAEAPLATPVRALLAAFHGRLAAEVYRRADLLTPGNAHARRWQERCGADRAKLRTVHPGMPADRFAEVGEDEESGDPATLSWIGRAEPAKDLIALLHAFADVRRRQPDARLRIIAAPPREPGAAGYLAHCRNLAEQLFPDEAAGRHAVGENPVSFEELGGPEAPTLEEAYASSAVVVLSSVVEGFPVSLVEAMFCARATVSTDVGAVVEVIGGTGLVVPPRNPKALADACLALLRDPERRHRLGAAARARALELFTVEQNLAAFRGIYLELLSRAPVCRRTARAVPFAHPAEAYLPGSWADQPVTAAAGTGDPDA